MNTLVIVLIAAVILFGAYVVYGRWLANKWGIDPKAETPAVKYNDGKDFVPTNGWTVFSHQFSSIAGAGPVTGAIQAAAFGWLPVLLWILIGGVFFGAVTDFGALYASVKNEGKSMGMIIEKYIGKFGRKIFLLFCWLFTLIVIAAFADMVAGKFNAYTVVDGQSQLSAAASTNGSAGMDLYACIDEKITINPGQLVLVPTGIAIELPDNSVAAFLYARSGLGIKHGICLSNGVGVVDSDYRGEICAGLCNVSDKPYEIEPFERICQMVIAPVVPCDVEEVTELGNTERGEGGFGSTGKK